MHWGSLEWAAVCGCMSRGGCVAVTCQGVHTQLEGFPKGPRHPKPLPMLGTPLFPGSLPGSAAHGARIRPHSSTLPLGSPQCDQPPAMHAAHPALPIPCAGTSLLIKAATPFPVHWECPSVPWLDPIRTASPTVVVQPSAGVLWLLLGSPRQGDTPLTLHPAEQVSSLGDCSGSCSGERGMS